MEVCDEEGTELHQDRFEVDTNDFYDNEYIDFNNSDQWKYPDETSKVSEKSNETFLINDDTAEV